MNIALTIQKLRKENGMSQEYLAEKLGVSRPTLVQIEKGERELTISEAQKIAKIFGMSFADFLKGKKTIEPQVTIKKEVKKPNSNEIRISVPRLKADKFKEVLLYVLEKMGARPHVGQTVIYKLLYFIEFDYYEKFEEQMIGAKFMKNHFGPTPVSFQAIVEEMEKKSEIEVVKSKYFQHEQKKYLPRRVADLGKLTAREIKHIDDVLARLGEKNATELSNYSHDDVPWITAEEGKAIDYESVFYRTPKTSVRNYDEED